MNEVGWMMKGPRSGITFITDPNGTSPEISRALARLDAASAAVTNPERPGWYRAISRLGYAWYLVIAILTFAISLGAGSPVTRSLFYAVVAAAVVGPITGGLLSSIARKQATVDDAAENAKTAAAAERHVVRIPQVGVVEAVRAVLDADPSQDGHVRDLAWRISATDDMDNDPDADAAASELFALQDRLDPEGA